MVQIKINEIKSQIHKREKEQNLRKARDHENKADMLMCKGLFSKAAKKYKKAIQYAKDRCVETEANSQFKLGKLYFEKFKDYNQARMYLVDFQLLTFVVKVRTDEISKRFQQAKSMMITINK